MPHAILIDDNLHNMAILAQLLLEEGVSSTQVAKSINLNEILENSPTIDIIFLDLEMPDMNGYELITQLKAQSNLQSIPIVAHTVFSSQMHIIAQSGFHSFIGKPLNAHKFPDQLNRILNGVRVWEIQ